MLLIVASVATPVFGLDCSQGSGLQAVNACRNFVEHAGQIALQNAGGNAGLICEAETRAVAGTIGCSSGCDDFNCLAVAEPLSLNF